MSSHSNKENPIDETNLISDELDFMDSYNMCKQLPLSKFSEKIGETNNILVDRN